MSTVRFKNGTYRGQTAAGQTFRLIKGLQAFKKGKYVTVQHEGQFPEFQDINTLKIKVKSAADFEVTEANEPTVVQAQEAVVDAETDEQALGRIRNRFSVLDTMTKACAAGQIRSVIVTGPPGVGKTFGVRKILDSMSLVSRLGKNEMSYQTIKGTLSAIGLYCLLFRNNQPNNILVFDDCDIWDDQDAISILKAALDSSKVREVRWMKDSAMLRREDIPNTFEYKGTIIFLTNCTFEGGRPSKITPHLDALKSRAHFLDLTVRTVRDKMLRVRQVHNDSDTGLFEDYRLSKSTENQILDFMWENRAKLNEISMRMAIKIADLVRICPDNWQHMALVTCAKE